MDETQSVNSNANLINARAAMDGILRAIRHGGPTLSAAARDEARTNGPQAERIGDAEYLMKVARYMAQSADLILMAGEPLLTADQFITIFIENHLDKRRCKGIEDGTLRPGMPPEATDHGGKILVAAMPYALHPLPPRPSSDAIIARRETILAHLQSIGSGSIREIADATGIPYTTVSNDLHYMRNARDHGRSPKRVRALGEGIYEAIQETSL